MNGELAESVLRCDARSVTRQIMELVTIHPGTRCWRWMGSEDRGYGVMQGRYEDGRYRHVRAHRLTYEVFNGEIPDGLNVCHSCDTPSCVNPEHLFAGTQSDNITDMYRKGRREITYGSANAWAKFTEDQIAEMLRYLLYGLQIAPVARTFGIAAATLSFARSGKRWKAVPRPVIHSSHIKQLSANGEEA